MFRLTKKEKTLINYLMMAVGAYGFFSGIYFFSKLSRKETAKVITVPMCIISVLCISVFFAFTL